MITSPSTLGLRKFFPNFSHSVVHLRERKKILEFAFGEYEGCGLKLGQQIVVRPRGGMRIKRRPSSRATVRTCVWALPLVGVRQGRAECERSTGTERGRRLGLLRIFVVFYFVSFCLKYK